MSAGNDFDPAVCSHPGSDIPVLHRDPSQGSEDVEVSNRPCGGLKGGYLGEHGFPQFTEDTLFNGSNGILGPQQPRLVLLELGGDIALGIDKRLFAYVVIRRLCRMGPGDL